MKKGNYIKKEIIKENDDWVIENDKENQRIIISKFEEFHYQDEITLSYEELNNILKNKNTPN